MTEVETKITIKLNEAEFKSLQKLLEKQYQHDVADLTDNQKDLVNGIFFRMNECTDN